MVTVFVVAIVWVWRQPRLRIDLAWLVLACHNVCAAYLVSFPLLELIRAIERNVVQTLHFSMCFHSCFISAISLPRSFGVVLVLPCELADVLSISEPEFASKSFSSCAQSKKATNNLPVHCCLTAHLKHDELCLVT